MNKGTQHPTDTRPPEHSPAGVLGHPDDVLQNPSMTPQRKREILAAWASDAHAVENVPALRQLDDGSVVALDEILQALKSLDDSAGRGTTRHSGWRSLSERGVSFLSGLRTTRRDGDGDDDPPPCPASAALPVRIAVLEAVAA
jgi:hypothetical protein